MKKLVDKIKLDRIITLFLSNLVPYRGGFDYKFKNRGEGFDYKHKYGIYDDEQLLFFCNIYKNKMVIRTYIFEEISGIKYNRYIHNKIVEFVGLDYDYVLYCDINTSDNVISIDEYEANNK